jgi:hypothetical protein
MEIRLTDNCIPVEIYLYFHKIFFTQYKPIDSHQNFGRYLAGYSIYSRNMTVLCTADRVLCYGPRWQNVLS